MRPHWAIALATLACGGEVEREGLVFEGPLRVTVDTLGPVDPPTITLLDGSPADGILWSVSDTDVAQVVDNVIVARAPGVSEILGKYAQTSLSWTLVVAPVVSVRFLEPPHELGVGESVTLRAAGFMGEEPVPLPGLAWSAKPEGVLRVDGTGKVQALKPGTGWIVASSGPTEAVAEIVVRPR